MDQSFGNWRLEVWEIVVNGVGFVRLVPVVVSSVGKIEIVDADVVDLEGVVLAVRVPRRIPFVSLLPEGEHLLLALPRPRLLVALVDAAIGEEVASHGHVQYKVELEVKHQVKQFVITSIPFFKRSYLSSYFFQVIFFKYIIIQNKC